MLEPDDVDTVTTNIVNPASFLSNAAAIGEPVTHDCLETIKTTSSSRPDLKEEPLLRTEAWFTDGSSFVRKGVQTARDAVTTAQRIIEARAFPAGTSAQKAEITALTGALELANEETLIFGQTQKMCLE